MKLPTKIWTAIDGLSNCQSTNSKVAVVTCHKGTIIKNAPMTWCESMEDPWEIPSEILNSIRTQLQVMWD